MAEEFLGSGIRLSPVSFNWGSTSTLLTTPAPAASTSSFSPQGVMGVASGIGGIFSAISAMQSSQAQKDQLSFQSNMSGLNAQNAKFMGDLNSTNSSFMGDLNARQIVNVAEINARMAELAAETEMTRGQSEYGSFTLKKGRLKSSQRANMAANGIDLGVGSAAEELTTTDIIGEIDGANIISNAVRSAWGYKSQAVVTRSKAALDAVNARAAGNLTANNYSASGNQAYLNATNASAFTGIQSDAISPMVAGTTSLLGSATRAADTWYKYRRDAAISSKLGISLD